MIKKLLLILLLLTNFFGKDLQLDPTISTGVLKNGMKYTIKKNPTPKNVAEFRLLVKVGSLEEDDSQKGLAHFVEHMAFNGSKHFEKNRLIESLESLGVIFGSHLNASTSYDRTLYQLSIPVSKTNLEKSFLIFEDWAAHLSFDKKEFDKERGIILEEARSRDTLSSRLLQQSNKLLFADSKYLNRAPIGDLDIVRNAPVKEAKRFYKDWYRPEFMEFVAVGDFDKKEIEKLIKKHFGKLKNRSQRKLVSRDIPNKDSLRIATVWDKELNINSVGVQFLEDSQVLKTESDLKNALIEQIVKELFNVKSYEENSDALLRIGNIATTKGAYKFSLIYHDENPLDALETLYTFIWNFYKFGISNEYLKLVKKRALTRNSRSLNIQSSKREINSLITDLQTGSPFIDKKQKSQLTKKFIEEISKKDIDNYFNKIVKIKNKIIIFQDMEKREFTLKQVKNTIKKSYKKAKGFEKQKKLPKVLVNKKLPKVKILKKVYNKELDLYELTLQNGINVIFKKSDYRKNRVFLKAFSLGGSSVYDNEDINDLKSMTQYMNIGGTKSFSNSQIDKILSGKRVVVNLSLSALEEEIEGSSSSKDLESMFQLLYLKLTEGKLEKKDFEKERKKHIFSLEKNLKNPKYRFGKDLYSYTYNNNPRVRFIDSNDVKKLRRKNILKIYKDRFVDLNNFTFVIVGDIELKKVEKLLEKYFGSFPTKDRTETYQDRELKPVNGYQKFIRNYNNKNISSISFTYRNPVKHTLKNEETLKILMNILRVKLRKKIREEKSGVYGISINGKIISLLDEVAYGKIDFSCDPKRKKELVGDVKDIIQQLKENKVTKEELETAKNKSLVSYEYGKKSNGFWLNKIVEAKIYKRELESILGREKIIKDITDKDVQEVAKKVFGKNLLYSELNPK
ncbi:MAG: insulinase family protein [Campylobacterales bacterium]|nr:insulinase family protein [Campylobacterales bacterium]